MNSAIGCFNVGKSKPFIKGSSCLRNLYRDLLGEIKRKITDIQPTPQSQLVPVTRELDFDKFKKEASLFTNELKVMKGRQTELEKVTKMLYGQNTKLLKENKLLWGELIKNKY